MEDSEAMSKVDKFWRILAIIITIISILLMLFYPVKAYDVEEEIKESQLPYETIKQISFQIDSEIDNLYLTPSTSWISVPKVVDVKNKNEVIVNASIIIPEGVETKAYDEFIIVNNTINTSKITFFFNIVNDNLNISYEKTDLVIEAKDLITKKPIVNMSVKIKKFNEEHLAVTDSNGFATFQNIDVHNWVVYTELWPDYKEKTNLITLENNLGAQTRTILRLNQSINTSELGIDYYEYLYEANTLLVDEMNRLFQSQPEKIFVNNTIFEPVYINKEAYYEKMDLNPKTIERLENSINSWKNMSMVCSLTLEKSRNENEALNQNIKNCLISKKEKEKQNILNIIYIFAGEIALILIIFGAWFVYRNYDISMW